MPVPDLSPTGIERTIEGSALLDDDDITGDAAPDLHITPDSTVAHILTGTAGADTSADVMAAIKTASSKMRSTDVASDRDRACLAAAHYALAARSGYRIRRDVLRQLDGDALARHFADAVEQEHGRCALPSTLSDLLGRVKARLGDIALAETAASATDTEPNKNGEGQMSALMGEG